MIELVAKVAPGLAARYLRARQQYEVARLYAAASPTHLRPQRGGPHSGDAIMEATQDALRKIARHLDENHDLATGVLDDLVANTIGDGRIPAPMVRLRSGALAERTNAQILERYQEWAARPDVTQQYGMGELERLIGRSWLRDGEVFPTFVRSSAYGFPTVTRVALEVLEADYLPFNEPRSRTAQDPRVVHGIEIDAWGKPRAFHFLDEHPGDVFLVSRRTIGRTVRVPAARVLHLKFVRRLHQYRGVPVLHAALNRLRDIHDYEDSERIAARMAADLTAYIKRSGEFRGKIDDTRRVLQMQAGAFFELQPGEDVGTIKSERPNTGLMDFRAAMLRAVSAGTMSRYSSIARDYNGTYSAQRQELVEASINYRALFAVLNSAFYLPIYRAFLDATPIQFERGVDPATIGRVQFRPPALPWIDPEKEAKAWQVLIDARLESRAEIMRMRGRDPAKVRDEIEQEQNDPVLGARLAMQQEEPEPEVGDDGKDEAA